MPIYELYCSLCHKKVELFRRTATDAANMTCPLCGGEELTRLISGFAVHRNSGTFGSAEEVQYIEGLESEDPRAMAAWAKRMSAESGEPVEPGFEQMLSQMDAGEMPEEWGGDDGAGDFETS